nr:hypothetical protein [Vibrio alginolyticus]
MRWENFIQASSCKRLGKHPGGVPEWHTRENDSVLINAGIRYPSAF